VEISGGSHARFAWPAREFVGNRKKQRTNEKNMLKNNFFVTSTSLLRQPGLIADLKEVLFLPGSPTSLSCDARS